MSVAVGEVMAWEVRVNIKHEICWCMVQDFRCCEKKKSCVWKYKYFPFMSSFVAVLRTRAHVSTVSGCVCCMSILTFTASAR